MKGQGQTIVLFASWSIAAAVSLALASILSGFGTRWGWWGFRTGLSLLRWTVYGEIAVMLVSLSGMMLASHRGARGAPLLYLIAFLISISAAIVPVRHGMTARSVPPIHDITTDPDHPPVFSAVAPLRGDEANPIDYGGPAVAEQQRKGYPDLEPALLDLPPRQAFDAALAAARDMGWEIVDANPGQGRIEATDTTFWFGFKDDVVIRVAPTETGSRVDVRSLSRVGRSDVGTNAKRIRVFLAALTGRSS